MKAIERFYKYLEYKGIKPTRYEKDYGLSNGYLGTQLKRNADLGESVIRNVIDNCLDLDPIWLLTGSGSMLKLDSLKNYPEDNLMNVVAEPRSNYGEHILSTENKALKRENELLRNENQRLIEDINLKNELIEAFRTGKIVIHTTSDKDKGTA